jgi:hypothetical protein
MARKNDMPSAPGNIGLNVTNSGPGTGFHSEASGIGTVGTKVTVGAPSKGIFGTLFDLCRKFLSLFKPS